MKKKPALYLIGQDNFYKFKEQIKIYISDETNTNKNTLTTILSFLRDVAQEWANNFSGAHLGSKNKDKNTNFLTAATFFDNIKKYPGDPKPKDTSLSKMLHLCYTQDPTCFVPHFVI
jgi:hypothetical protein